jgi:hypothetical protein
VFIDIIGRVLTPPLLIERRAGGIEPETFGTWRKLSMVQKSRQRHGPEIMHKQEMLTHVEPALG